MGCPVTPPSPQSWSEGQNELLLELWDRYRCHLTIARRMGRHAWDVESQYNRIRRLGIAACSNRRGA